ncbi:hypothetical protein [Diaphorobacter sp. MNS-0]|nr:hypothetical protein [Diaphorobacter sp. MNS-0]QYY25812.1 hypothetical protein K2L43_01095 [Diaphorobacter sp. MNS-0]
MTLPLAGPAAHAACLGDGAGLLKDHFAENVFGFVLHQAIAQGLPEE